jgi:hypothetical protein
MDANRSSDGWLRVARSGAAAGALLTFGYALLFIIYAVVRTSTMILGRVEPGVAVGVLLANAVTIALAALTWACLLALVTAPIGLLTALALRWLLIRLNPPTRRRAAALGGLLAALIVVTLYLVLQPRAGQYLSPAYPASLLFWFGLPGLVYISAAAWGGIQLHAVGQASADGQQRRTEAVIAR